MVRQSLYIAGFVLCLCVNAAAQTLPDDELQVHFSGYFDSFDVSVVYPNIAFTRKVSESTSINARYLVDMVSAASMRGDQTQAAADTPGQRIVDVVTSASGRVRRRILTSTGQIITMDDERPAFDDMRHEFGVGMTRLIAGRTLSLNGIYSTEHDYTSATLAGTFTQWFAQKNTSLQLGIVHSWDRVFPLTKDWKRDKNVTSFSANFSQVLSKNVIVQMMGSYIENTGYLADAYEQVSIAVGDSTVSFDPIHPDRRIRKAAAARIKFRLTGRSTMQLGYRYYWDTWDVNSHTFSGTYQRYLSPRVIMGLGLRTYLQSRAFFFQPEYARPEALMTADVKLDAGFSNELQFDLTINGGQDDGTMSFLGGGRMQYTLGFSIYHRRTDTPYWFSHSRDLVSANLNAGIRYRF